MSPSFLQSHAEHQSALPNDTTNSGLDSDQHRQILKMPERW